MNLGRAADAGNYTVNMDQLNVKNTQNHIRLNGQ